MSDMPRLEHSVLPSGQHAITSPDVKGFCIVRDTESDARRAAVDMVATLREMELPFEPRRATTTSSAGKHEAA